jgi:hypothetical protein
MKHNQETKRSKSKISSATFKETNSPRKITKKNNFESVLKVDTVFQKFSRHQVDP